MTEHTDAREAPSPAAQDNSLRMHRWIAEFIKRHHGDVYDRACREFIASPEFAAIAARTPEPAGDSEPTDVRDLRGRTLEDVRAPSDHTKYEVVLTHGLQSVRRAMEKRRKEAPMTEPTDVRELREKVRRVVRWAIHTPASPELKVAVATDDILAPLAAALERLEALHDAADDLVVTLDTVPADLAFGPRERQVRRYIERVRALLATPAPAGQTGGP